MQTTQKKMVAFIDDIERTIHNLDQNSEHLNNDKILDSKSLKVISLDLDETLIRATRIACNNSGGKQLKYWGKQVTVLREMESKRLLKDKPLDCKLNDEEYLRMKYGPPLFETNADIASPFRWFFPTDDFSKCWILIRCNNQTHKITSFYRVEYRPYCQHLIEIVNKYKKYCNVKVAISTMATRQYGMLVCEGLKLFKGYYEDINGHTTPFVDEMIGLEDWRDKVWDAKCPQFYGKKSLAYIGQLFGINPEHVIAIDDKPQIWTDVRQVIYAIPYNGGVYFKDNKSDANNQKPQNDNNHKNEELIACDNECDKNNINEHLRIDDILFKIAKYFESYLGHMLGMISKQRRLTKPDNKMRPKLKLQLSNQSPSTNSKQNNISVKDKSDVSNTNQTKHSSHNDDIHNKENLSFQNQVVIDAKC